MLTRLPFLLLLCIIGACERAPDKLVGISGQTMGTTYTVKWLPIENGDNKSEIQNNIESILTGINQSMSTYISDSELSLLNQAEADSWLAISDDLYTVISHAIQISVFTNGAFDITVGPLVNLWGFGPDPFSYEIPDESVLEKTKQYTGYENLIIDLLSNKVSKTHRSVTIDLSGIAKGFAVDKIAQYLDQQHIQNYLIEIGGELKAKGQNAERQAWQIGIEQPESTSRSIQRIINLQSAAMATSGDYRNYFEKDGIRYSHTIDPATGKPITHNLASVTVIDKSAIHADAMATAFMVLGREKTYKLADNLGLAVYTLSKTEFGFEEKYNEYFKSYLSSE
jgi:FAD:protein FMN transferase